MKKQKLIYASPEAEVLVVQSEGAILDGSQNNVALFWGLEDSSRSGYGDVIELDNLDN